MEASSSSNVTVEYFDPSGVFPLLSPSLLARLPLRHLHWKSPSRPLRSIASLHVDLVSLGQTQLQVQSAPDGLARIRSSESNRSDDTATARPSSQGHHRVEQKSIPDAGLGTSKGPLKERRHQIPGLRQTPYLKVYLLRCDDVEIYKNASRKQLREWIKEHTNPHQSTASLNNQEQHDAFEWLIVHVVLPNTAASAQPRFSGPSGVSQSGGGDRPSSAPRWPGRGTSTIFEKIRSDFNGSSKAGTDRVAQVRLQKTDIPASLLSDTSSSLAGPSSSNDLHEEYETAWNDLISKLKSLILTSFDLRVSQYEDDIRERDSQRSLPGWNFCTFFVLKEGLARGFESVGLVEDALIGYDELAFGLDTVVREQTAEDAPEGRGTTFLPFTEDLRRQAETARQALAIRLAQTADSSKESEEAKGDDLGRNSNYMDLPLSASRKRYRDLILSNNISIFDFRCYLFARQMSLLLRLANASLSRAEILAKLKAENDDGETHLPDQARSGVTESASSRSAEDPEDLLTVAEICRRGVEFITSVARTMKADLSHAYHHKRNSDGAEGQDAQLTSDRGSDGRDIEQEQIGEAMEKTICSWVFSISQQILAETSKKVLPLPPSLSSGTNPSTSKLARQGPKGVEPKTFIPESKTVVHPVRTSSLSLDPPSRGSALVSSGNTFGGGVPGDEPANSPARPGSEELAFHRAEILLLQRSALTKLGSLQGWSISLDDLLESSKGQVSSLQAVELEEPMGHEHTMKSHSSSVRSIANGKVGLDNNLLRIAMRSEQDFYNQYEILTDAALRCYKVAKKTRSIERVMTELAALKYRQGDFGASASYFGRLAPSYAESGWDAVQHSMWKTYAACLKRLNRKGDYVRVLLEILAKSAVDPEAETSLAHGLATGDSLFGDLLSNSNDLPYQITVPLEKLFGSIKVMPHIRHFDDKDGFQVQLCLRYMLPHHIQVQTAKVCLKGVGINHGRELWLENNDGFKPGSATMRLWVGTSIMCPGKYVIAKIVLEMQNIVFVHEVQSQAAVLSDTSRWASETAFPAREGAYVLCYPRPEALDAKIELSRYIHLDQPRSVEVAISSGWNAITKGELRLRSGSAGLRLRTATAKLVEGKTNLHNQSVPGVIEFGGFSRRSKAVFEIPYELEQAMSDILAREIRGYIHNRERPVQLHDKLNDFDRPPTRRQCARPFQVARLVLAKQPASLLYKVKRSRKLEEQSTENAPGHMALNLSISYRSLDEGTDLEISHAAESAFATALTESSFSYLSRLLLPMLPARIIAGLTTLDIESIGLLGQVNMLSFTRMKWEENLRYLPSKEWERLSEWLQAWHEDHQKISLNGCSTNLTRRDIVIPVEVPRVHVVHTVSLHLTGGDGKNFASGSLAAVGQTLYGELSIRQTRSWDLYGADDAPEMGALHPDTVGEESIEFVYQLHANPDSWILGGRKKARFRLEDNATLNFPVLLLPVHTGRLLLPTIEIKPLTHEARTPDTTTNSAQRQAGTAAISSLPDNNDPNARLNGNDTTRNSLEASQSRTPPMKCETDYINQADTVLVLPNVRSTTISLERGGPGGGGWITESAQRVTVEMQEL
ncbi:MAG: hypothetical protein M1833_000275 [Piccolia ochrophora]|nr:MAG: hypothetical protein M1833_000275 [Piccolia ochrophora]